MMMSMMMQMSYFQLTLNNNFCIIPMPLSMHIIYGYFVFHGQKLVEKVFK